MTDVEDASMLPSAGSPTPGAEHRRMVVLAWVAIALGVLALPGILFFIPDVNGTPIFILAVTLGAVAPITATIAWILAIIVVVRSGARLIHAPRSHDSKVAFALALPGAIAGTVAMTYVIIVLGALFRFY